MSHLMNFIPRRLAVFPTEREAMLYARQKLAEGLKQVNELFVSLSKSGPAVAAALKTELGEALAKEQPFSERAEAEALLEKWQAEAGQ